jgi:hypothetical protein
MAANQTRSDDSTALEKVTCEQKQLNDADRVNVEPFCVFAYTSLPLDCVAFVSTR